MNNKSCAKLSYCAAHKNEFVFITNGNYRIIHDELIYNKYYMYDTHKRTLPLLQNIQFLNCIPFSNKKIILSQNITYLIAGYKIFKSTIHMSYPKNITHLSIKYNYGQKITLPHNLTHLKIYSSMCQNTIKLPQNIIHLNIEYYSGYKIKLPQSVTHLKVRFSSGYKQKIILSQNITKKAMLFFVG